MRRLRPQARISLLAGFFVLSLVATGRALEAGALKLDANIGKVRAMQGLRGVEHDILFIGDSTTLEGVDAEVAENALEAPSFNLATGGQSLLDGNLVLQDYLRRNAAPRLIVLGVYINRARDGSPMNPDLFLSLPPDLRETYIDRYRALDGSRLERSYGVFNRLRAYRYRTTIDRAIKFAIVGGSRLPEVVKGQARFEASRPATLGPRHDIHFEVDGLEDFLSVCRGLNLPVAMVELPNHPGYSDLSDGRHAALELLESMAASDPLFSFRSFNDDASLVYADDEWIGLNHLNARGAARFTSEQLVPHIAEVLAGLEPDGQ